MFELLVVFLAVSSPSESTIAMALGSFNKIDSYSVTLDSRGIDRPQTIKYYYKKPGFVRMEFVEPHHGAVLVYDPFKNQVRLKPLGFLSLLVLNLRPEDKLIRSPGGHTVDESDIGALLRNADTLAKSGNTDVVTESEYVGGRDTMVLNIKGTDEYAVKGVHKYTLWLDKEILLPLRVQSYDTKGNLMEDVLMDDLKVNVYFPADFFDL